MSIEQAIKRIENAEKELALAREALVKQEALPNWYDGMPVLVKKGGMPNWERRFLKKVDRSLTSPFICYLDGRWESSSQFDQGLAWDECKQDLDAPSLLNWIPNTGITPNASMVLVKFHDGSFGVNNPNCYNWGLEFALKGRIKEYAIIIK